MLGFFDETVASKCLTTASLTIVSKSLQIWLSGWSVYSFHRASVSPSWTLEQRWPSASHPERFRKTEISWRSWSRVRLSRLQWTREIEEIIHQHQKPCLSLYRNRYMATISSVISIFLRISSSDPMKTGSASGRAVMSSSVNTDAKYLFSSSAICSSRGHCCTIAVH